MVVDVVMCVLSVSVSDGVVVVWMWVREMVIKVLGGTTTSTTLGGARVMIECVVRVMSVRLMMMMLKIGL